MLKLAFFTTSNSLHHAFLNFILSTHVFFATNAQFRITTAAYKQKCNTFPLKWVCEGGTTARTSRLLNSLV